MSDTPLSTERATPLQYGSVALGEPSDCEYCGLQQDEFRWSYDAEDDLLEVATSFGCYYGDRRETSDVDDAVEFARTQVASCDPQMKAAVEAELVKLREAVTGARA